MLFAFPEDTPAGDPERHQRPTVPPRYAFRLECLRSFHLVRASCHASANMAVIPHAVLRQGGPATRG